ncbi:MAG: histidine phosphatase family protein [Velocimicrobium sp.]
MDKTIYLIRHGTIGIRTEKRYVGITDLHLDNEGIEQAYFLKNYFKQIPINIVFTSPLRRCLQTSEIICEEKKQDYIVVKEFREINMGNWENISIASIRKDFPKLYEERGKDFASFVPPNGESFRQLSNRVLLAFDRIVNNKYENIMIVAHAGVNRVILSHLLGFCVQDIFNIQQPYGCVNKLILNDENPKWQYKQII